MSDSLGIFDVEKTQAKRNPNEQTDKQNKTENTKNKTHKAFNKTN